MKCQDERSQDQNRLLARQRLAAKIEDRRLAARQQEKKRRHLARQRSRRRSPQAQERVLQDKKYRAQKKDSRRQKTKMDLSPE